MNVGGRPAGGNAQDPLNYLLRTVSESNRLSKRAKAHVLISIRRVKQQGPYEWDASAAHAFYLYAYAETLYLREHMERLKPADKSYKPVLWGVTKLSEVMCKFKTRKTEPRNGHKAKQGSNGSALWQKEAGKSVPQKPDADTT